MDTTDIDVLTTPGCVGCTPTTELMARVVQDYDRLTWQEIDVSEHPEVAARHQIMAAPAVVIGGDLAFTGVPTEKALRSKLREYTKETT